MSDWTRLGTGIPLPTRGVDEVVEEEDGQFGPLIVTFLGRSGARYVGVAIERLDDGCVRWIEAPVQTAEWDSARRGITALRDLFRKAEVDVVDRGADLTPVRAWRIAGDLLRSDQLPEDDATLEVESTSEEPEQLAELVEDVPPEATGRPWDGPRKKVA